MRLLLIALAILIVILAPIGCANQASAQDGTIPPSPLPQLNKLLVIGDSLTSGLYATHEQATFVSLLGSNTGYMIGRRNGAVLPVAAQVWAEVKAWQPNIVVIEVGLNDVSRNANTEEFLDSWEEQYRALIVDIQATGAKVVLCTTFWGGIQKSHKNFNWYMAYNEVIRELAEEQGVMLADLWAVTLDCDECVSRVYALSYFGPHYHGDNFHPSDRGHAVIAREILKALGFTQYYMPVLEG